MGIDIRTIILIIGISHLMQVFVFFQQCTANKNINGPGWWLLWSAFESLAFLLMLFRNLPGMLSFVIIFQDGIILAGTLFVYIGVLRFFNKKINWNFIVPFFILFMVLHLYFFIVDDNIQLRSFVFDLFVAVVAFLTAIGIYRNKFKAIAQTANFNVVIFTVHGSVFVYRSIMIMMGTSVTEFFAPTFFNFIQYFDALFVALLWTFGFIIMLNQKLNYETSVAKMHFEQIFNTSPDAVVITRLKDGLFVDCNENFTKITGYSKLDIDNRSTLEINIWKNPNERYQMVAAIENNGFYENAEISIQRKNGTIFTGLLSAKKIMLNETPHIITVTRDISNLKQAEAEIKIKNEELQKINAVKDKLFSIIAHDLRSPFTTILGYIDMLQRDLHKYPIKEIEEMLGAIQSSAQNSYKLLENLLNWAKTQTGQLNPSLQNVYLNRVVENVILFVQAQANKKNIGVNYHQMGNPVIFTDENVVNTVLRNLVSNAIKFTNHDGIINITALEKEGFTEISVSDNGIGISDNIKNNLFVDVVHQSQRGTDFEKGTGIGLTICKEFIENLGGKIWVESELGKGTTFYFTIPKSKESN